MNAKPLTIALLAASTLSTPALAQDVFGHDTLSSTASGAVALGAVFEDETGALGVAHVGTLVETVTRSGTTTSIELVQGDLDEALLYDFAWTVEPQEVSDSMQAFTEQADATELLGIIIRNTEGEIDLQPLGIPVVEDSGYVDIQPLTVLEIAGGIALSARTVDDMSRCCLLTNYHPMTAASLDDDGYVQLDMAATVIVDSTGTLIETATSFSSTGGR